MSRKIVDVKTLKQKIKRLSVVKEDIKRHLADGWELSGSIVHYSYKNRYKYANYVIQDMVKYEEDAVSVV